MEIERNKLVALIIMAIVSLYFLTGFPITENNQDEIPCESYDECFRISEEIGLDKTKILCETVDSVEQCKVVRV